MSQRITPSRDIARLIEVMAALRTPGTGCPWDLEQTFETIAPYTIEEAYEVADAIARDNMGDLKDELGDLLLQVAYHARLAEEAGAFAFPDVVEAVTTKMIRRHPHVFSEHKADGPDKVRVLWEDIKAAERREKAERSRPSAKPGDDTASADASASVLADVPLTLPALTRAVKLQSKAARVGFDWPNLSPVFEKLKEEISEFEEVALLEDPRAEAVTARTGDGEGNLAAIREEFGDMLFVMANIARHLDIDPETALRGANEKFVRRFAYIERGLAKQGRSPAQSTLDEMDALWDEAKAREKA